MKRTDELHPLVYKAMAGFALWFALSAWLFFASFGYTDLVLAVVSFFMLITVAVPFMIWIAGRDSEVAEKPGPTRRFRDWMRGEFEIWQGRVSGKEVAIEILLPLAAVAVGATIFGIALHLDVAMPS
jgi:hypothetical protein